MIKNFEEVKKQLGELSNVVNKFKSEQVQLKIVDLIFRNGELDVDDAGEHEHTEDDPGKPRRGKRRGARKRKGNAGPDAAADGGPRKATKAKAKGSGPSATLQLLLEKSFFDKKRTIGEVVEYCKNKLARTIPMNQLSGPLARLVREDKLDRSKNAENQFEYIKK